MVTPLARIPSRSLAFAVVLAVFLGNQGCISGRNLDGEQHDRVEQTADVDAVVDDGPDAEDEGATDAAPDREGAPEEDAVDSPDAELDVGPEDGSAWEILPESCDRVFQSDFSCEGSWACPDGYEYCCSTGICGDPVGDPPFPGEAGCCHEPACGWEGASGWFECFEVIGEQILMPDHCLHPEPLPWHAPGAPRCPSEKPYCCSGLGVLACSDHQMERWSCGTVEDVTGNDTCASAWDMVDDPGSLTLYVGSTSGMADDAGATCAAGAASPDAVYRLVLAFRATVNFYLLGFGFDTALHVKRDSCPDGLEVGCDYDRGSSDDTWLGPALDAGTYYVFVDGYDTGNSGSYELKVRISPW